MRRIDYGDLLCWVLCACAPSWYFDSISFQQPRVFSKEHQRKRQVTQHMSGEMQKPMHNSNVHHYHAQFLLPLPDRILHDTNHVVIQTGATSSAPQRSDYTQTRTKNSKISRIARVKVTTPSTLTLFCSPSVHWSDHFDVHVAIASS